MANARDVEWDVEAATMMMVVAMHSLTLFEMESVGPLKPRILRP